MPRCLRKRSEPPESQAEKDPGPQRASEAAKQHGQAQKVVEDAVADLGGKVTQVKKGISADKHWIEVEITY